LKAAADSERMMREKDAQAASALAEADRVKRENEERTAAAATEAERVKREADARTVAAVSEADRLRLQGEARDAAAKAEADRLKLQNDEERAASMAALDSAAKDKARLIAERSELRILLLKQFNAVLQTRDTARGLIVNMSDVLFDTAKSTLRPAAREKLAKVAGIVSGHPGLRLEVEGFTDSVGGDAYNQQLSENRGDSVRDYLVLQGMPGTSVTAKGFGETRPVADNGTAQGRQQNRRVELVISGEVIGTVIGTPVAVR
jgi:outer membrane protein OmpA-like peptidoglycan-associated protein